MTGNKLKTKKKDASRNMSVRKVNPMYQQQVPRPRMNFSFDGQQLNGSGYSTPVATLLNTAAYIIYVDFSVKTGNGTFANTYERSMGSDYTGISGLYNEFIYHTARVDWVPWVSPGTADGGSQVYIDYIENPEIVSNATGGSVTTVFNLAKNGRNAKFFNAWERFSYHVPLARRRKTFDVNTNSTYTIDICDRTVQGAVFCGFASSSAAVTLGQFRITYLAELQKLNNVMTT